MMLSVGAWAQSSLQEQINATTDGSTVLLTENYYGQIVVPAASNLVLDLNGYNIEHSGTVIINNGTLTIKDTSGEGNGTITSTGNYGICTGNNSTTTFASGNIVSQEFGIGTSKYTGATINVTGGTITAKDNAVFGGNGTERSGNPNTFNISGGTFYGQIQSPGYVACGIYAPWKDVFNVSGGTFNITGGCGVLARAGTVNITGGDFICTGTATGMVGDSRVVVPCSAIVYDSEAGYPAMTAESKIEVPSTSTATFKAEGGVAAVSVVGTSHIEISGGTYSSPLTEDVCAEGYIPSNTPNADGTYGAKAGSYVAQIGATKYETLAEAITAATAGEIVTLIANVNVDNTILIDKNITINGGGHNITSSVNNKLGTFYVNVPTSNFTITNATIDGNGTASMAVCAYRGVAKGDFSGVVSTDNNNAGNVITLTDCTVKNFTGYPGSYVGAVYAFSHSHLTLNTCTFTGNTTSQSTNGASGADVWTGAATTVVINGGTYNEVFVNTNSTDVETVTINGGAKIEELAICVSYKADGSTNIPVLTIDNATVTTLTTEEGNPVPADVIRLTNGGTITNMPATEAAKILNAKDTKAFASLDDAITAANTADTNVTITLLVAATATVEPAANVTIDADGKALTLPTFNVADGAALSYAKVTNATDNTYKVTTATYNRTGASGTQWGTACLPFSFESAPTGYTLYTPSAVTAETLTVTEVSYPVAVGTPVIFFKDNTGEATITSSNANIKINSTPAAQSGTIHLVGTFSQQNITSDLASIYFINGDKFHQAKASLTVPAYRAYITNTSAGAKPAMLQIAVDSEASAIESVTVADINTATAIYDANGRKLSAPQKGMNIMKLANGKTLKLIVK